MPAPRDSGMPDLASTLQQISASIALLQHDYNRIAAALEPSASKIPSAAKHAQDSKPGTTAYDGTGHQESPSRSVTPASPTMVPAVTGERRTSLSSKITLTSYPGQSGVDPLHMSWGHPDPISRGPVVVGRNLSTIRRRNGTAKAQALR